MAFIWTSTKKPYFIFLTLASTVVLFLLFTKVIRPRHMEERDPREMTDSAAERIDPAAMDLTPLVNTLINSSQSGSRQLFSLLSVTSYSSLALHKLTLLVYNISNSRSIENQMFRRRFCYCVTNETNDLTDFAAILLDVMGNSTSYLHELFKSASIVSVSQRNNSECIYICVMAGKMGRTMPELWDVESISPLFNKTIVEGPHRAANISLLQLPFGWYQLPTNLSQISPSGISSLLASPVQSTAHGTPAPLDGTASAMPQIPVVQPLATASRSHTTPQRWQQKTEAETILPRTKSGNTERSPALATTTATPLNSTKAAAAAQTKATFYTTANVTNGQSTKPNVTGKTILTKLSTPKPTTKHPSRTTTPLSWRTTGPIMNLETEKPGCPWKRPDLTADSLIGGSMTTVSALKLQPCLFELCKFFSQCLCRPFRQQTRMKRYCDVSHFWYEKHTFEVCRRVKRISFSRNLKQRCLTKMCNNL